MVRIRQYHNQQLSPKVYSSEFLGRLVSWASQLADQYLSNFGFLAFYLQEVSFQMGFTKNVWGICLGFGCLIFGNFSTFSWRINVSDRQVFYLLSCFPSYRFSVYLRKRVLPVDCPFFGIFPFPFWAFPLSVYSVFSSKQSLLTLKFKNSILLFLVSACRPVYFVLPIKSSVEVVEYDLWDEWGRVELKKVANLWLLGIITLFLLLERSVKRAYRDDFLTELAIEPPTQIGFAIWRVWKGDLMKESEFYV